MKITAFTTAWNCETAGIDSLIDWYLNHLKIDKFIYADNHSTDNTKELLISRFKNDERLIITDTPYSIFTDNNACELANSFLEKEDCDAFIWVDSDEIIYHPNLRDLLREKKIQGKFFISNYLTNVYNSKNTFNNFIPIINNFEMCFTFNVQKTPIIIKTDTAKIKFSGGHHVVNYNGVEMESIKFDNIIDNIAILHFCYITKDFYIERKTSPKNHLRNNNILFDAIKDEGWWSRDIDTHMNIVEAEKQQSIPLAEFLETNYLK